MKFILILATLTVTVPTLADTCEPYLRFEPNLTIDPRVSQALPGIGLNETALLDMLRGPRVLIEDPDHPSEVLRVLYARSPADGLVYATDAIVEMEIGSARVFDLIGIHRIFGLTAENFEELIDRQAADRRMEAFAGGYRPAYLDFSEVFDPALRVSGASVAGEYLNPANDDDDDRVFLAEPVTGVFARRSVFLYDDVRIRAARFGVSDVALRNGLARATHRGQPFTRLTAHRLVVRWPMDERLRWFVMSLGGRPYAVVYETPNDRVVNIIHLTPVAADEWRANPAWP